MSYTDQDVREGRRLMDDGRENRLVIGDKLLSVTASGHDSAFDRYCDEISLNPRTARQYRHTARMCTPPVRQLVAGSGVHVSYSALREGARLAPSGKPYDEGYSTLRLLLEDARAAGAGRVSVTQYRRALGMGPALQDLLNPASDMSVAEYLSALPPAERDKVLRDLVEEDVKVHDAIKRAMDDKRRRDRENRGPECGGGKPDKAHALARDLVRLRDQATAFMNRYPPSAAVAFTGEQRAACAEVLGTLEVLATWIKVRIGGHGAAADADRVKARDLVTV
ncbi:MULTISPECIES: hypothetical protein [unclassified Streptomyces]|uniref:hypothetical protein n=1 Tax=unclassified Streptomyces TaxID=2593676 RepID=UPI0007461FB7|nr:MULTISPECIES: hypothetical protein [unclassified Streptomyces]KUL69409.1 hypothetical protein ADL33_30995 [Streptomyces sp. NRRL WC-3604]KUL70026.1 hypothetical protein ADL34_28645 [Streptomyces sp. NRRL WC-3605]